MKEKLLLTVKWVFSQCLLVSGHGRTEQEGHTTQQIEALIEKEKEEKEKDVMKQKNEEAGVKSFSNPEVISVPDLNTYRE